VAVVTSIHPIVLCVLSICFESLECMCPLIPCICYHAVVLALTLSCHDLRVPHSRQQASAETRYISNCLTLRRTFLINIALVPLEINTRVRMLCSKSHEHDDDINTFCIQCWIISEIAPELLRKALLNNSTLCIILSSS
jgi:hypothetical protein